MAEIKLFRIDSRLIHGQIITKWLKVTQADKIVVVDEMLAADDFMKEVYVAAVPKGISVDIYDTDQSNGGMGTEPVWRWKSASSGQGCGNLS